MRLSQPHTCIMGAGYCPLFAGGAHCAATADRNIPQGHAPALAVRRALLHAPTSTADPHSAPVRHLGGACGRRAYTALTWLGVDPSVPKLGGVTVEQYHG